MPTSPDLARTGAILSERMHNRAQAAELWSVVAWYGQTAEIRDRAKQRRAQLIESLNAGRSSAKKIGTL